MATTYPPMHTPRPILYSGPAYALSKVPYLYRGDLDPYLVQVWRGDFEGGSSGGG